VANRIKNVITGMPSDAGFTYGSSWGKIKFVHLGSEDRIDGSLVVEFKAFIKRFTDNFNGDWKEAQYPNQSVPIAHQVRPRRDIHIEWTVPAASEAEAISNLGKCAALAQMMLPTLKKAGNWSTHGEMYYPKSSFVAIKFANLIQSNTGEALPGYIRGFNYTPNFEEGVHVPSKKRAKVPKQIKKMIEAGSDTEGILAPMFVDIALDFTPFYIRSEIGYKHGDAMAAGWQRPDMPYSADFGESTTTEDKAGTATTDICIKNPSEGGYHDVCSRSMFAGIRGVTK